MNTSEIKVIRSHGVPYPLGATVTEKGVNFALYSESAQKVELCLFDETGEREVERFELSGQTNRVWHILLEGLEVGALYAYRVYGPYEPQQGLRFNHHKLLLDPYAKKLSAPLNWSENHYGYLLGGASEDLEFDRRENASAMPKCVVVKPSAAPTPISQAVEWSDTVIYETHVKGYTKLNQDVPEELRGTYAGLCHPSVIEYLKNLGITSIELLPVHFFVDEHFLIKRDLNNYWGYNTLNFFAPHKTYSSNTFEDEIAEFKFMVSRLHEAGIEVILDVVYNHSAEGGHLGPTLSYKGIDNRTYYSLEHQDARLYVNDTGCGNTFNAQHPKVIQLILDSLRYWSVDMGVDGFRFDLATVLGREKNGFDPGGGFLDAVHQDPVLNTKKLIAEPWDIGPGGYQLSHFPAGWSEWNDRYRDTVRRYWRGDVGLLPEFARRIHGSSDLFEHSGRQPSTTINFVTSHDGFTMRDLVSYNQRHNFANKEQNNDGHHANFSHNFGVEGETSNELIESLRLRQQRNFLATLILSQGTPMILAGDELGRTQSGNNNAYCQDNSINWLDWSSFSEKQWGLRKFVSNALRIRREFSLLRSSFYIHKPDEKFKSPGYNIHWLNKSGGPMREMDWQSHDLSTLGWMLESVVNAKCVHCLLTLFNPGSNAEEFKLPKGWYWIALLDTAASDGLPVDRYIEMEESVKIEEKTMIVLYGMSSQCELDSDSMLSTDKS